jgi:hypothetical protein
MTDAYDTWREAKKRLGEAGASGESAFLHTVEEHLRPAALTDFLERFVRENQDMYDDAVAISAEDETRFLTELDELRQPTYREDETRAEMQIQVSKVLTDMRQLNWTGDHTYGDALDDASLMLRAVLAGRPAPRLERFRCPSQYHDVIAHKLYRCKLQLPHDGNHSWADENSRGELVGPIRWTDIESVNPPKSYNEPAPDVCGFKYNGLVCELQSGHTGHHLDTRNGGESHFVGAEPLKSDDGLCAKPNPLDAARPEPRCCVRPKRHAGMHRDQSDARWHEGQTPGGALLDG